MSRHDEKTRPILWEAIGHKPASKFKQAVITVCYIILVCCAFACLILALTGCALVRLPGNVEAIRDAAENVKADADALADDLTKNPATKQKLADERKRLDASRTARDSKDANSMNWLLTFAGSLFGVQGGLTWMSILTAVLGFYRASREKTKKEASMDAVDVMKDAFDELATTTGSQVKAPEIKERAKIKMVQKAQTRGVHSAIEKDLEKRKKKKAVAA